VESSTNVDASVTYFDVSDAPRRDLWSVNLNPRSAARCEVGMKLADLPNGSSPAASPRD